MKQTVATGATVDQAVSNALKELGLARDEVSIDIIDEGKKGFLGFGARDAKVRVTAAGIEEPAGGQAEGHAGTAGGTAAEEAPAPTVPAGEPAGQTAPEPPEDHAAEETVLAEHGEPDVPDLSAGGKADMTGPVSPVVAAEPLEPVRPGEPDHPDPEEDIRLLDEAIADTADYLRAVAMEMGAKDVKVVHMLDGKNLEFSLHSPDAALLIGKRGQTLNALQQLVQVVANNYAKQFLLVTVDAGDYRLRRKETLEILAERKADQAVRTGRRVALEPMPSSERKIIHHVLSERFDVDTHSEGKEPHRHLVIEPHK
ncbi:RNA-binding cell elongation regulator Jag/EloR [Edaphobacillus lindanitolerans]|uniref:RNA-binding protein KhpB n=1 Tax=Edaphobacillus lindanitolerans TaxID=550447 RepID=A0A1U7PQP1_9BACI|nr:RNA-binding cell elongation regulator Jag/EloR [Edaphobacillus lindanitolerans]SIT87050.1 spoIIIJ-associated protein [Edaphobacillus lindanitolerans]